MRVLVTNDDGVHAPGITALAKSIAGAGYETVVVAPRNEASGSGAALGPVAIGDSLEYDTLTIAGLEDVPVYGLDGPPALCVLLARMEAFGDAPDIVVSGINPGHNTGRAVLHSGTVGAALTAANFGASGLAVSIGHGDDIFWDTACAFAVPALDWLVEAPAKTVLNMNLPNIALDDVAGVQLGRLAAFGAVRTTIVDSSEGRMQLELRPTEEELAPDTDTALVLAGYVAVTSLIGVRASGDELDVVDRLAGLVQQMGVKGA